MGKFIEEFYYGNLDPQARSTKENKTVQKQMEVLMLNEDFLTENLSGENKKKFLDFCNAWGVVNGESNLDSFIMGFRLGANFTYETFVNDELLSIRTKLYVSGRGRNSPAVLPADQAVRLRSLRIASISSSVGTLMMPT